MKKISKLFLGVLVGFMTLASNASAAVVFDFEKGEFVGFVNLISFFQSVAIMLVVVGAMTCIKLAMNTFRRPYGGGGGFNGTSRRY
ncbi:MAG: hypothetical protein PHW07_02290 [Sulfurospirillaceae bacterium]|nr:hypothetical protein [Sulfurospirillaceae bacterium]